ncbi:MAG5 [Acrasis kona]|uniref:MAG5 n=1 Tax=Acrasis kona TaxID=1008807 RepID=A0AAW2ZPJ0_9EUKA
MGNLIQRLVQALLPPKKKTRQVNLGQQNEYYYDENLGRWMLHGAPAGEIQHSRNENVIVIEPPPLLENISQAPPAHDKSSILDVPRYVDYIGFGQTTSTQTKLTSRPSATSDLPM